MGPWQHPTVRFCTPHMAYSTPVSSWTICELWSQLCIITLYTDWAKRRVSLIRKFMTYFEGYEIHTAWRLRRNYNVLLCVEKRGSINENRTYCPTWNIYVQNLRFASDVELSYLWVSTHRSSVKWSHDMKITYTYGWDSAMNICTANIHSRRSSSKRRYNVITLNK